MHNLYPQPVLKTKNNMKTISLKTEMELLLVILKSEMPDDHIAIETVSTIIQQLESTNTDWNLVEEGLKELGKQC